MVRYQGADAEAVGELIETLSPRLMRYFGAARISPSEVEDLCQECWMRIHASRHTYRSSEPLLPWIFAIARHTRLDGYRRLRRKEAREVLVAEPPDSPVRGQPEAPLEPFLNLLGSLPESQRDVLLMLKVTGMTLDEVARATGSTVGAIKQKAHRAYARLRFALKKDRE